MSEKLRDSFRRKVYIKKKFIKKDYFYKIVENLKNKEGSILDIGCASGDLFLFINWLIKNNNFTFHGIEKNKNLVDFARKRFPKGIFFKKDIFSKNFVHNIKYNYIICAGTINLFNDLSKFFKLLSKLTIKNKTKIIIFDLITNDPMETRTNLRIFKDKKFSKWINTYNIHSEININEQVKKQFKKFKIKYSDMKYKSQVKKKTKFSLRSWTVKIDNEINFVSRTNQILYSKICIIDV